MLSRNYKAPAESEDGFNMDDDDLQDSIRRQMDGIQESDLYRSKTPTSIQPAEHSALRLISSVTAISLKSWTRALMLAGMIGLILGCLPCWPIEASQAPCPVHGNATTDLQLLHLHPLPWHTILGKSAWQVGRKWQEWLWRPPMADKTAVWGFPADRHEGVDGNLTLLIQDVTQKAKETVPSRTPHQTAEQLKTILRGQESLWQCLQIAVPDTCHQLEEYVQRDRVLLFADTAMPSNLSVLFSQEPETSATLLLDDSTSNLGWTCRRTFAGTDGDSPSTSSIMEPLLEWTADRSGHLFDLPQYPR